MKDGAYVINLNKYKSTENPSIALYMNGDSITYFDSLKVEYIPNEI